MDEENVEIKANVKSLELYSDTYPFSLSLRVDNFDSEASYKKFVKNCEFIIRKSTEYKAWRNYIIDVLQINECVITQESIGDVTIDVHHHIPSMYTLVCALVNEKLDKNEEFCTFDICTKAITLHFENRVGYVTLLKSMHEKFHNGKLGIPISKVKGNYRSFIERYGKHLDELDIDKINDRLATTDTNCKWTKDNYPVAAEM